MSAMEIEDSKSVEDYKKIIAADDPKGEKVKEKEQAIYALAGIYAQNNDADSIRNFLKELRAFFGTIPKGKTAKIVRTVIDQVGSIPGSEDSSIALCDECIEWCTTEKRTFLKLRIEGRLSNLYLQKGAFKDALTLISKLVREVKKIDDKLLLVEIHLVESRVHYFLKNIPKAKGALTSARSAANSIYCPPLLQAQIDLQAGTLCAEEKDYKTGFSYFYEAFEGYNTINNAVEGVKCLKYMLLCKIMSDSPSDVYGIINGKAGIKHAGIDVEAMKAIADAHKERSIHAYTAVKIKFKEQLVDDPIINSHLAELYENLLEQNLLRLIEPFSRVEISHVAELINLPLAAVEIKLSEMILDQKFNGILDQGTGDLIVYDEVEADKTFTASLSTIKELSGVVDKLYAKAQKIQ